jgi:hypothetical protein
MESFLLSPEVPDLTIPSGIQNQGLGYHIPTYKDFYNFNVGDIFEFHKVTGAGGYPSAGSYQNDYYWKWTILSKAISGNSLLYSAYRLEKDHVINWATQGYDTKMFSQTDNLVFTDSTTLFQNGYNGENIFVPDSFNTPVLLDKELYFGYDTTFKTTTKAHIKGEYFRALNGDTVSIYSAVTSNGYGLAREKTCGNGIGLIYYEDVSFFNQRENYETISQIGCIKNGIQYGQITPDSLLKSTGIPSPGAISSYQVYPTFQSDNAMVHIKGAGMPCEANLYNIQGQRVLSCRLFLSHETDAELDLESLLPGMYFLQLSDRTGKSFSFKLNKEK